jgi:hypothetical protein
MTLLSLAALVPAILMGIVITMIILPKPVFSNFILKLMIGVGVGIGLVSCLYFLLSILSTPHNKLFLLIEILFSLLGIIYLISKILQDENPINQIKASMAGISVTSWILVSVFLFIVCVSGVAFILYTSKQPYGHYDAFSIWNYRARNIYLLQANWLQAFSPQQSWETHPDYPLLVPFNILRLWILLGTLTPRAPVQFTLMITFATLGLLFSSLGLAKGWGQASMAGLVLLGTPWFFTIGASQIADMPIAYAVLATCILYFFYLRKKQSQYLLLAGVMAGMAGWTKNEGLMFIAAFSFTIFLQNRHQLRNLIPFLEGLAFPLGVILLFKIVFAPSNDLFALQTLGQLLSKITSAERYQILAPIYWKYLVDFGGWRVPILLILSLLALFFHDPDLIPSDRRAIWGIILCCALTFAGYTLIFIISPHPLAWHAKNSAERLMFHFYPTLLFVIFISIRNIDQVVRHKNPQIQS